MLKKLINWKLFWILFGGGILGVIAILPYTLALQKELLKESQYL